MSKFWSLCITFTATITSLSNFCLYLLWVLLKCYLLWESISDSSIQNYSSTPTYTALRSPFPTRLILWQRTYCHLTDYIFASLLASGLSPPKRTQTIGGQELLFYNSINALEGQGSFLHFPTHSTAPTLPRPRDMLEGLSTQLCPPFSVSCRSPNQDHGRQMPFLSSTAKPLGIWSVIPKEDLQI